MTNGQESKTKDERELRNWYQCQRDFYEKIKGKRYQSYKDREGIPILDEEIIIDDYGFDGYGEICRTPIQTGKDLCIKLKRLAEKISEIEISNLFIREFENYNYLQSQAILHYDLHEDVPREKITNLMWLTEKYIHGSLKCVHITESIAGRLRGE